jgi:phenylacetate-coenzyme A ligase PaaK-like adenylate-forming protein
MSGQSSRASPLERSEPVERASLDELRAIQLVRLKQALARAAQVLQYRKKFADAGIAPGDLERLDDLKGFPFTTKEDFRQNYPFAMFAVPMTEMSASMRQAVRQESLPWLATRAATLSCGRL